MVCDVVCDVMWCEVQCVVWWCVVARSSYPLYRIPRLYAIQIITFVVIALVYYYILPFAVTNYYVLRLVIHPFLMNIVLFVNKRVAQALPHTRPYTEYTACVASFILNSMFGRILLARQNDVNDMVLGMSPHTPPNLPAPA